MNYPPTAEPMGWASGVNTLTKTENMKIKIEIEAPHIFLDSETMRLIGTNNSGKANFTLADFVAYFKVIQVKYPALSILTKIIFNSEYKVLEVYDTDKLCFRMEEIK